MKLNKNKKTTLRGCNSPLTLFSKIGGKMNKINDSHQIFARLVGRVLGTLDLAHVDENLKRTIKAYIWQAEKDLNEEGGEDGRKSENQP